MAKAATVWGKDGRLSVHLASPSKSISCAFDGRCYRRSRFRREIRAWLYPQDVISSAWEMRYSRSPYNKEFDTYPLLIYTRMRKQFLLMLVLCLTASLTWAERIDVATARKVAGSVAQREGVTSGLRSASDLSLVYAAAPGQSGSALRSGTMEGSADYFVFNFPGEKGFAIVRVTTGYAPS